jgi:hypothetical protein
MNEFRHTPTPDAPGDPLERLVEAFVGQSAPEGPDAAVQLRLVAAMRAADAAGEGRTGEVRSLVTFDRAPREAAHASIGRRSVAQIVGPVMALAAMILVMIGLVFAARIPQQADESPTVANLNPDVVAPDPVAAPATPAESRVAKEVGQWLDKYLAAHGGKLPDQDAYKKMLEQLLRDRPELAQSEAWQFAQARLTYALEQPKVLTLGVGILGTLPWTTYGRF